MSKMLIKEWISIMDEMSRCLIAVNEIEMNQPAYKTCEYDRSLRVIVEPHTVS